MTKKEQIINKAFEILERAEFNKGMRSTALIKQVAEELGENRNTCSGNLWNLSDQYPDKVFRPYRGLFILKEHVHLLDEIVEDVNEESVKDNEEALYQPTLQYLLEQGECTHAVIIGGNLLKDKWGTPDILGVVRADSDAPYRPIIEIVAVEVKKGHRPVEALGQAMAYKLFSHRTWLVLPDDEDIRERVLGIAISANIGLISFTKNGKDYDFVTLNRPNSSSPDLTAVNDMLNKLKLNDRVKYNDLIKNERN